MRRLNILFLHSTKFDYTDNLYKHILSSSVCMVENIILQEAKENKSEYIKDLIKKSDLIFVDISETDFFFNLSYRWANKYSKEKTVYISSLNKVDKKYKNSIINNENNLITSIEETILKLKDDLTPPEEIQIFGEM